MTLGRPEHDYIFVADYEELVNYTISEAIYKLGGTRKNVNSASVIIFPLEHRDLYPASARGVLQVVKKIDQERQQQLNYTPFDFDTYLKKNEIQALSDERIESWSWITIQNSLIIIVFRLINY